MNAPEERRGGDLGQDQDTPRDDVTEGGGDAGAGDIGDARREEIGGVTTGGSAGTGPSPASDAAVAANLDQARDDGENEAEGDEAA